MSSKISNSHRLSCILNVSKLDCHKNAMVLKVTDPRNKHFRILVSVSLYIGSATFKAQRKLSERAISIAVNDDVAGKCCMFNRNKRSFLFTDINYITCFLSQILAMVNLIK